MQIDILTIFPDMFESVFKYGVITRALRKNIFSLKIHNLRDYSPLKHGRVDDEPYGGGPGMIMMPEPIFNAVREIVKDSGLKREEICVILLSPDGKRLNQSTLKSLSSFKKLIIISGRYEGVDERVKKVLVDRLISIGDYVISGGEVAAMVLVDGVVRLIPGVLGNIKSLDEESFFSNLLDYPQYTRPANFEGIEVPEILLSGNHKKIAEWRKKQAKIKTEKLRSDLLK
ncbi:MAG: tRNA (guanosine(37)-N1)-methyltransferase TrmD [Actinobacteria bacterium]|nr:tRNA (guanosine(37)-N1)-methyltransferase TrmD [Actinomycetota bacterium]